MELNNKVENFYSKHRSNIILASHTQRSLESILRDLFQEMYELGYADGECQSKKDAESTWSEDDEIMLKSVIATCELAEQDRDSSPARHLYEMQNNWLKSLKERMKGE